MVKKKEKVSEESPTLPTIAALRTTSRDVDRSVFSWNQDPLALEIQISAPGRPAPQIRFDVNFQVVDCATNVVRRNIWLRGLRPQPGNFPVRHGDDSRMTPKQWGLGAGLYLFRAIIEIPQVNVFALFQGGVLFRVR